MKQKIAFCILASGLLTTSVAWGQKTSIIAHPSKMSELQPNTIDCKWYTKLPDGRWHADDAAPPFDLGEVKGDSIAGNTFGPRTYNFGGQDLYDVLDVKCGSDTRHL